MKCRKLPCYLVTIRIHRHMAQLCGGGDRKLAGVVEPLIEERANPMKFIHGDKRIPIRHGTPATRPGMQVVPRQTVCVRDQRRPGDIRASYHSICRLLRIECFAVKEEFRVEFAWTPCVEYVAHILSRK